MITVNDLKEMFVSVFGDDIKVDNLNENTDLRADIGMNSVSFLYMAMVLEEKYGVQFDNNDFTVIKTVKDVIDIVESKVPVK